ncbi:hypothetical protein CLV24_1303 [Pontibacter ummariensis]|uniref:Uncharacterized protein n=1 Tax=Pontibacter ummariensis TaxID=1610492 RepID=A0A239KND2_9BACT|nr:hypothetical protein CLV24_1303 [Pontibacter ummariensis]SNT19232.1 hypothetical protein SAMN06296052_1303 [Pontibacter ummariensis]
MFRIKEAHIAKLTKQHIQLILRHLLLSLWVFDVEKLIGRIVKRFLVVWEHLSGYTQGHCC